MNSWIVVSASEEFGIEIDRGYAGKGAETKAGERATHLNEMDPDSPSLFAALEVRIYFEEESL